MDVNFRKCKDCGVEKEIWNFLFVKKTGTFFKICKSCFYKRKKKSELDKLRKTHPGDSWKTNNLMF